MHTFRVLDQQIGLVPAAIARTLGAIDTSRGREDAYRMQRPQVLEALVDVARIQSTEASNAIEDVVAPRKRIEALVKQKTAPRNRSEAEIAGYRAVLDLIHEQARDIPFRPSVVEQLHRDLYQYTAVPAGRWKTTENAIEEELPDGTKRVRFRTVAAAETPAAMDELHAAFLSARDAGEHHPLLLIGCYVFDFLAIHPFRDGNGRMARLLTLLLLYQSGYGVGRYVSLERLVNDAREGYYSSLQAAGIGWHDDEHTIWPWLEYLLGILLAAYREFENRVEAARRWPRGEDRVHRALRSRPTFRRVHHCGCPRGRARSQRFAHRQGARPPPRRGRDRAVGHRTFGALATTLSGSGRR